MAKTPIRGTCSVGRACIWFLIAGVALTNNPIASAQVNDWAFRRLEKAQNALSSGELHTCASTLNSMKQRKSRLSAEEVALMWQLFGHLYFTRQEFSKATSAFENALSTQALEDDRAADIYFNLGQLHMTAEKWNDAVVAFEHWLSMTNTPSASASFVIGQSYMEAKRWRDARAQFSRAVAAQKKPPEAWLNALGHCQFRLKETRALTQTLFRLLDLYPKSSYWLQLAGAYDQLGEQDRALAVYELAYESGFLNEPNHLRHLAQLLIHAGLPLKAASILESEIQKKRVPSSIDSLRLLAEGWSESREIDRATQVLSRAARMGNSGPLYVHLAELYLQTEQWPLARQSAEQAIETQTLKDKGNANLISGIASFYSGDLKAAGLALKRAARSENENTAKTALQWLTVVREPT